MSLTESAAQRPLTLGTLLVACSISVLLIIVWLVHAYRADATPASGTHLSAQQIATLPPGRGGEARLKDHLVTLLGGPAHQSEWRTLPEAPRLVWIALLGHNALVNRGSSSYQTAAATNPLMPTVLEVNALYSATKAEELFDLCQIFPQPHDQPASAAFDEHLRSLHAGFSPLLHAYLVENASEIALPR